MSPVPLRERPGRPFELDGESLTVRVRESDRARTTRILVGPARPLEIIVPAHTPDIEIDQLLKARRGWISDKVARSRAVAERPWQLGLDRPGVVWLQGRCLPIERRPQSRAAARLSEDRLLVGGHDDQAREAAQRWYRRSARAAILSAANQHARRLEMEFASLSVRDQRTRWGSCSRTGNLSFNWRLILAPAHVLEYVVVHELCHLRVANHTKAFWRLLEGALPQWRDGDAWLREHGAELRAYRVRL